MHPNALPPPPIGIHHDDARPATRLPVCVLTASPLALTRGPCPGPHFPRTRSPQALARGTRPPYCSQAFGMSLVAAPRKSESAPLPGAIKVPSRQVAGSTVTSNSDSTGSSASGRTSPSFSVANPIAARHAAGPAPAVVGWGGERVATSTARLRHSLPLPSQPTPGCLVQADSQRTVGGTWVNASSRRWCTGLLHWDGSCPSKCPCAVHDTGAPSLRGLWAVTLAAA